MNSSATILAIDPGTVESGWCLLDGGKVFDSGVCRNDLLLNGSLPDADLLAIEVFEARGMPIGNESIETILFTGRMMQCWIQAARGPVRRVKRSEVKRHLCGTLKAKDSNIRQALIDKFGGSSAIGKKANKGPLYGVKSHAWAALAVAVTAREMNGEAAR